MIIPIRNLIVNQTRKVIRQPSRIFTIPFLLAAFIFHQIAKTIHRPARIGALLIRTKILVYSRVIELLLHDNSVSKSLFAIAKRWMPASAFVIAAGRYFQLGQRHLDANEPESAWKYFRHCLRFSKEPVHFSVAAICLMAGLGRFQEAMTLFTRSNMLLLAAARASGITDTNFRFLDQFWVAGFGHMAQMDYFIKLQILEGRSINDSLLYIPRNYSVPNRFFLDQWRPFLRIIEDDEHLPMRLEALNTLSCYFLAPRLTDGSTAHLWEIGAKTYRRWEEEKRLPLLKLDADTNRRGWDALEKGGIPRDAWFVVLHVREASSRKYHSELHNVLNADIDTYALAIEEITRRGGWVVRMGDPSMRALPPVENVFDYCHSNSRSDWMDIFLCANARFFVGTSSGPAYVPTDYGVPCVHTNWWPPAQRPWHSRDIFIPKLYRQADSAKLLTISQSLQEPFGYCSSMSYLKRSRNVDVIDSSPDEIRGAVLEMLERLEGKSAYDTDDIKMREKVENIYRSNNTHGAALLARAFLRKHSNLVD